MLDSTELPQWKNIEPPEPPLDNFGLIPDNPMGMFVANARGEWFHTDDVLHDPPVWVEVTDPEKIKRLVVNSEKNRIDWNEVYHPFESARDAWFAD